MNARLSQHLSVKENVTVVRKDDDGEKVIVSYVVPSQYSSAGLARRIDQSIQNCIQFGCGATP